MIKVSIIVPVYNIEKDLLVKCIDSLINQTLQEKEIILVDDASTKQETIDILNRYNNESKIVIITHSKNKKQGGARNTGLKVAKGEYIGFVDADDYIDLDMYRQLYNKAIEETADIVDCDYLDVDTNGTILKYKKSISDMNNIMLSSGRIWTKIFLKNMLISNKIFFPENMFYEDNAIAGLHTLYANKVSKINKYLYYYVRHSNSTISNASLHLDDKIKAGQIFYDTMNERGFIDQYKDIMILKYFEIYFKITYRLIMKYDLNYINTLNNIITDMKTKGVSLNDKYIQSILNKKEKLEIWMLLKVPKIFKLYVDIKYSKYKVIN